MPYEIDLLVVGVRWPPETFIRRKLASLAKNGLTVAVAASVTRRQARGYSLPGVTLVRLPHHSDSMLVRATQLCQLVLKMLASTGGRKRLAILWRDSTNVPPRARLNRLLSATILAQVKPGIVNFEWNTAAISYERLSEIWECPQVVSCRGSQINIRPYVPGNEDLIRGLRRTFQRAAAVHCVSSVIQREAQQYGLDPGKAWIIRPAVDSELFFPNGQRAQRDTCHIISVGSLIWRKGYEYALMAVHHLKEEGFDVAWEIVGDGPERQRVLYTMQDLKLEDAVTLAGQLTPEQILARLQNADIFLLSSLSEGISNAVLEAMACGLPIVTTDCGGMREAVTHGIEGFVVPARNPEAMAEALAKLVRNPELREQMGRAGRERILQEFTLEQQTQQFLALYQSLMAQQAA